MATTFWSGLNKYDKRKLIYVYVFSPLFMIASIGGNIQSEMYRQYGSQSVGNIPCGAVFGLAMIGYMPTILPAIAIRFGYFRRALSYGLELFVSMWVSIIVSLLLVFFVTGVSIGTQGLLATLAVYCVLSYGATGYNDIPKRTRYSLTFLTMTVPFIVYHLLGTYPKQGFSLLWESIFIAVMVNCHTPKSSGSIPNSSEQTTSTEPPKSPPPPHSEQCTDTSQLKALRLINLGLACIGRKTKRTNLFFTPEREAQRRAAERTFLLQLANMYKDASARKVLAKHFMLYKEVCLFIIFATLLKDDQELHSILKPELTKQLNEGLTPDALKHRKEYMFAFSKAFYDEYQRTHSMKRTLSFTFWSVLRDKHPQLVNELPEIKGLGAIYQYVYGEIKRECN